MPNTAQIFLTIPHDTNRGHSTRHGISIQLQFSDLQLRQVIFTLLLHFVMGCFGNEFLLMLLFTINNLAADLPLYFTTPHCKSNNGGMYLFQNIFNHALNNSEISVSIPSSCHNIILLVMLFCIQKFVSSTIVPES
jgi:hypothetical protein